MLIEDPATHDPKNLFEIKRPIITAARPAIKGEAIFYDELKDMRGGLEYVNGQKADMVVLIATHGSWMGKFSNMIEGRVLPKVQREKMCDDSYKGHRSGLGRVRTTNGPLVG